MTGTQKSLVGSTWHRWDPHIHTPGTLLANRFSGDESWDDYLQSIEQSSPRIRALGVTDYAILDEVERVLDFKKQGRLTDVDLIFANVELRYELTTTKGKNINVHLLISTEQDDWAAKAQNFLNRLQFEYQGDTICCNRADLIRLGRAHAGAELGERQALKAGVNQFKVTRVGIAEAFQKDRWARENALLAVSGTSGDGTSGLQNDAGMAATRDAIHHSAHVIFASSPKQRTYWIGKGVDTAETLRTKYGGVKLCLHGSDSHCEDDVGKPYGDRFTWIKGGVTFEALRQACIEPELRAIVDTAPPVGPSPSRTISAVEIEGTDWFKNGSIPINPGLVGIIGARGSGKTALADLIAAGGLEPVEDNPASFLYRARSLLQGTRVRLRWQDGTTTERTLGESVEDHAVELAGSVKYLSQQFVEQLCSSEGLTDELLREIERVVFDSHPEDQREGAVDFRDLLAIKTDREQGARRHHEQALTEAGAQIEEERLKHSRVSHLQAQHEALATRITQDKERRKELQSTNGSTDSARLLEISTAADARENEYTAILRRRQSLLNLRDEVQELRDRELPERVKRLRQAHAGSGLTPAQWDAFNIAFAGDPTSVVERAIEGCDAAISSILGPEVAESTGPQSLLPADATLSNLALRLLRAEAARLKAILGLDAERARKLEALERKIRADERSLGVAKTDLDDARGARDRITELQSARNASYASIVDAIQAEEAQLKALYVPVAQSLQLAEGALSKLEFVVSRVVDVDKWAAVGEELIDLRTEGDFRLRGSIANMAKADGLAEAWQAGSGAEAAKAVTDFRDKYTDSLVRQRKREYDEPDAQRVWAGKVSAWLTSTDHITLSYAIRFEGMPIEQLSPGTRGIVLLLLYLALDQSDDRPLIIDQPEENLDPASIFTELVGQFREARLRRQVIIVTHNANLIVNTDADQVIAASDGVHRPGKLPPLSYIAGGLDEKRIRGRVCQILEGGEDAFKDRARRLRVQLD